MKPVAAEDIGRSDFKGVPSGWKPLPTFSRAGLAAAIGTSGTRALPGYCFAFMLLWEMANEHVNLTKSYPRDIEAQISFLPTSEGGKKIAARTGYRPQFRYDGQDHCAVHTFPDVERVNPGETVKAYIAFLSPEDHRGKLSVGKTFQLREGVHVMANGLVTRIIELETRKSAPLEPPSWNYLD